MRAEDLLPDHINQAEIGGVTVRKGSIGAFLFNAKTFSNPASTVEDRATAERDIADGIPALRALGLFEVLEIRDEQLRAFVEAHCDHSTGEL